MERGSELKYWINWRQYVHLSRKLKTILPADKHTDHNNEYHIRSLYFDTPSNDCVKEKADGTHFRKKYRIRLYNKSSNRINLEVKFRIKSDISKISAPLDIETTQRLIDGSPIMLDLNKPAHRVFSIDRQKRTLRPIVIVDYTREAYTYKPGNVRITFDKDLRSSCSGINILNPKLPTVSAHPKDRMILEVKYTGFLPHLIRRIVEPYTDGAFAISKYVLCRNLVLNGMDV